MDLCLIPCIIHSKMLEKSNILPESLMKPLIIYQRSACYCIILQISTTISPHKIQTPILVTPNSQIQFHFRTEECLSGWRLKLGNVFMPFKLSAATYNNTVTIHLLKWIQKLGTQKEWEQRLENKRIFACRAESTWMHCCNYICIQFIPEKPEHVEIWPFIFSCHFSSLCFILLSFHWIPVLTWPPSSTLRTRFHVQHPDHRFFPTKILTAD